MVSMLTLVMIKDLLKIPSNLQGKIAEEFQKSTKLEYFRKVLHRSLSRVFDQHSSQLFVLRERESSLTISERLTNI